ncbi:MAG: hypothetical protein PHY15_04150 [Eubacteriales bacterium]|nr:hypothetical protein [Eubacteriales bacterium]MDD4474501.1 hypothetical protein [Eubacteriales bacterium]
MKKKLFLIVSLFILSVFLLNSCSAFVKEKPKTFSDAGMKIELTNKFSKVSFEPYTVCYNSGKVAVFALKEEFTLFSGINYSLEEYAEVVLKNNSLSSEVKEVDGLVTFTFKKDVEKTNFSYFASVYKTTDAYWLIQFACESSDYETYKDEIIKYAKSVTFD